MAWPLKCFMRFSFIWIYIICFSISAIAEFKVKNIKIQKKIIKVEVAETPQQHTLGLMFREKFTVAEGMLFVFSAEEPRAFWMKNTLMDLSIAFFNKNKKIIDIQEMKSGRNISDRLLPSYRSAGSAMYALEMPAYWFSENKINVGQSFEWVKK